MNPRNLVVGAILVFAVITALDHVRLERSLEHCRDLNHEALGLIDFWRSNFLELRTNCAAVTVTNMTKVFLIMHPPEVQASPEPEPPLPGESRL